MQAKLKIIIIPVVLIASCVIGGQISVSAASNVTYQKTVNPEFTIGDAISVSLSSPNLVINDLLPGQSADSNEITVTVTSNVASGYSLESTVGNSEEYDTDALVHTSGSSTGTFTNLATAGTLGAGEWGYAYATYDASSGGWGSYSSYDALPLYSAAGVPLINASTNGSTSIKFRIGAHATTAQIAGEYNNIVNFIATAEPTPTASGLYDTIAAMSKGAQAAADLQQAIVTPSEETPISTNSGVYEYNADEFGAASDASNDKKIYYYRGVLDSYGNMGTYGSDGLADAYPNYVVLSSASDKSGLTATDTCWRIVRTTGSGGVKMIYNGVWNTTNKTCANAQTAAQLSNTSAYNGTSSTYRRIALVGYTYNPTYGDNNVSTDTSVGLVFGSNSDYSKNISNSKIKNGIETWFTGALSSYESILETSAGYCNDRSAYSDASLSPAALETIEPYVVSGTMYFGAGERNRIEGATLSLTCPRGTVDLYSCGTGTGNGQLGAPIALITADETALVGSGYAATYEDASTYSSNYSYSSFLRSGSNFWLLSPRYRYTGGGAYGFYLNSNGSLSAHLVSATRGVRPAISLIPGTTPVSGEGIATDPWIVNPPSN